MSISVEANADTNKSQKCCYASSIKKSIDVKINKLKEIKKFLLSATNSCTENSYSFTEALSSKHYKHDKK